MPVLKPVTVVGALVVEAGGKSTLNRDLFGHLPGGNGSINEQLQLLPDVRLDPSHRSSSTAGEILPPDISISGGKSFDNNYSIDGFGNNSLLDPTEKKTNLLSDVPGHPQELFLNANLIEAITVYDSNIPARFGGFTGGVVDAQTRFAGRGRKGEIFYRTTRDEWTSFHRSDRASGETVDSQPKFRKEGVGIILSQPLGEDNGFVASAQRYTSTIPLPYFGGTRNQKRRLDNYFLKFSKDIPEGKYLDVETLYTPYSGEYFIPEAVESDFRISGGGLLLATTYGMSTSKGDLEFKAAFRRSLNSREAPQDWMSWFASDSKDWGRLIDSPYSYEGGFGSIEKSQTGIELRGDFTGESIERGSLSHVLSMGGEAEWLQGSYEREETTHIYVQPRFNASVICDPNDIACVDGEQFFTRRDIYDASETTAEFTRYALYCEDRLNHKRLEVRPGLRLSYDTFMKNFDVAPRLSLKYDLFDKERTLLVAGLNRYYGRNLMTFKLREARRPYRSETRSTYMNRPEPWSPASFQGANATVFSRLKTPYSDEYVLGVDQTLFGGRLSLKYVQRQGYDEFVKEYGDLQPDGLRYYTLTNDGWSRHRSYRVSWERRWEKHFLSINANLPESRSRNRDFDEVLSDTEGDDRIWYDGQIVYKGELPHEKGSDPMEIKVTYIAKLPKGFRFATFARFVDAFSRVENSGEQRAIPAAERRIDLDTGEPIDEYLYVYDKVRHSSVLVFDWKVEWERPLPFGLLSFDLEVDNVFDRRVEAGETGGYETGRQFWVGMEYLF